MRGWLIDAPDAGPPLKVGKPVSAEQVAALKQRVDEAREKDTATMSFLERMRRRQDSARAPKRLQDAVERKRRKAAGERDSGPILPSMTEQEIRDAGLRVDLPTEAASAAPKDIRYADGTTLLERLRKRQEDWEPRKRRREHTVSSEEDEARGAGDTRSETPPRGDPRQGSALSPVDEGPC